MKETASGITMQTIYRNVCFVPAKDIRILAAK